MKHIFLISLLPRWYVVGILLFPLFSLSALAQQRLVDSLKATLLRPLPDTARANAYYDIANAFYKQGNSDSAEVYLKPDQEISVLSHCLCHAHSHNCMRPE